MEFRKLEDLEFQDNQMNNERKNSDNQQIQDITTQSNKIQQDDELPLRPSMNRQNSAQVRQLAQGNMPAILRETLADNFAVNSRGNQNCIKLVYALTCLIKLTVSGIILDKYPIDAMCYRFKYYIILMMVFDAMYFFQQSINYIYYKNEEPKTACYKFLRWTAGALYLSLFLYGNYLLIFEGKTKLCASPLLTLIIIYMICQYLSIFKALVCCIVTLSLACFCGCCLCVMFFCCGNHLIGILARVLSALNTEDRISDEALTFLKTNRLHKYSEIKLKLNLGEDEQDSCPICQEQYKFEDNVITLTCSELHYFHEACIIDWLNVKSVCPVCRANI